GGVLPAELARCFASLSPADLGLELRSKILFINKSSQMNLDDLLINRILQTLRVCTQIRNVNIKHIFANNYVMAS
ncbi:MAG: hypothetical protein SNG35_04705, partial [Rikenellaceae bacterium]